MSGLSSDVTRIERHTRCVELIEKGVSVLGSKTGMQEVDHVKGKTMYVAPNWVI